MEWTREVRMESDEEKEKKPKKARKPRSEAPSGDEGEPRKKRRGKLKRAPSEQGDEDGAIFTDEDDVERPAKKVGIPSLPNPLLFNVIISGPRKSVLLETMMRKRLPILAKSSCMCFNPIISW